jgi:hypothetical protein
MVPIISVLLEKITLPTALQTGYFMITESFNRNYKIRQYEIRAEFDKKAFPAKAGRACPLKSGFLLSQE